MAPMTSSKLLLLPLTEHIETQVPLFCGTCCLALFMFILFCSLGLTGKDINVFEVHDCFSIAEILMYEALGLAYEGKGTHLVRDGETDITGRFPVNTGGGLIAFGHPVGATGIKQVGAIRTKLSPYIFLTLMTISGAGDIQTNERTVRRLSNPWP